MKHIKIFDKQFGDFFNRFSFSITVPSVSFGYAQNDFLEEKLRIWEIAASNHINYTKGQDYWTFQLTLMGFGIYLFRQWGY